MARDFKNLMLAMLFGSVLSSGTAPYVITALLKDMDASLTQMALVPMIVQCGGLFGLPIACLLGRLDPKRATILMLFLGRSSLAFLALLLLTPFCGGALAPALVLSLYAASVFIGASAGGPASLWFKEIVPSRFQGAFLGRRNAYGSLVVAALMPLFGYVIDRCSAHGIRTGSVFPFLMIIPLAAGYLDLYFLGKVKAANIELEGSSRGVLKGLASALKSLPVWRAALVPAISQAGALILAPFSIVLCFDLGMSGFATGSMMTFSAIGVACGMIYGGKLSDRSPETVRGLFVWLPAVYAALLSLLALCASLVLAGVLGTSAACAPLLALFLLLALVQGASLSVQVKFAFHELKDSGLASFALLSTLQNLAGVALLGSSVWLGAWASSHADAIRQAVPGFHYLHIVFACSIACGALASIFLGRALPAAGRGASGLSQRTNSKTGDSVEWNPSRPSV